MINAESTQKRRAELTERYEAVRTVRARHAAELKAIEAALEGFPGDAEPEDVVSLLSQREALQLIVAAGDRQMRELQEQIEALPQFIGDIWKRFR